ncbi:hypothetical protein M413DRAFT_448933 [Hebeloma cylindrosporum]|uniref:Uncharacterized protein n=1 Tax=Hebeloma cylindrosporum TaxID=76867 RepID=A0A0C2Y6Z0_HEBCY|nr:hypothetical protein M413DRAFT_448933 [Hebeloma cylindrosporum h7]
MKIFKSLLLGALLTNSFVAALPFSGPSSESDIAEREDVKLLARNDLFTHLPDKDRKIAIEFVKNIPLHKLKDMATSGHTIHSADEMGQPAKGNKRQENGFRLDHQGMTSGGYHNLQVQINGAKGKSTVGGILVKGKLSPGRVRNALIFAVKTPAKKGGVEFLRKYHVTGKAPTDSNGKILTNEEARKRKNPRKPKPTNPNSRRERKKAKK